MSLIDKFYNKIIKNLSSNKKQFYFYGDKKTSYHDLFVNIKKINFYLKDFKNANIGLYCDKTDLYYAAVIAILLSGNTWIQIPKSNPKERNRYIINESKIDLIIGDENLSYIKNIQQIKFDQIIKKKNIKDFEIKSPFDENDIACIFFTSGSTGKPKGVKITYLNMISCLMYQIDNLKYKKKDVFSDFHDSSFVMSLVTILPCIYVGGSIVPFIKDTDKILATKIIKKNKVNVLITVPSFMMVLNYQIKKKLKIAKIVLCGENFSLSTFKIVKHKFKFKKLFNCYGATELSPWAFFYEYKNKDRKDIYKMGQVPIGKPFRGIFVKGNKFKELLINGSVVSEGYTEKKINKLKFTNLYKKKFYNTGDLFTVYKKNYFILGRNDKQIKIHGYRVNLLEIDTKLRKLDKINFSLSFFKNNSISTIYSSNDVIEDKSLENFLKQSLPNYMIPKRYFYVKKIKFNKNGKVDRDYLLRKFK
tara:strand:+ start:52951 stop:54375 length:1425 start_codon:yes stop_codon:yes gene_type:complete